MFEITSSSLKLGFSISRISASEKLSLIWLIFFSLGIISKGLIFARGVGMNFGGSSEFEYLTLILFKSSAGDKRARLE